MTTLLFKDEVDALRGGKAELAVRLISQRRNIGVIEALDIIQSVPEFSKYIPENFKPKEQPENGQMEFPFADKGEVESVVYLCCPHCHKFLAGGHFRVEILSTHILREHPSRFWKTDVKGLKPYMLPRPFDCPIPNVTIQTGKPDTLDHKVFTFPPRPMPLMQPKTLTSEEWLRKDYPYTKRVEPIDLDTL